MGGLQNAEILIKLQFKSPKHGSRLIEFVHFLSKMSSQMIMVKVTLKKNNLIQYGRNVN
jgi:hypothetical protein